MFPHRIDRVLGTIAIDTRQAYDHLRSSPTYHTSVTRALSVGGATSNPASELPRLRVLGSIDLEGGAPALPPVVAKPRRLALLVYLTATSPRRFHTRDELMAMFWPEHDDAHGRAALRQAIHVLRRSLGARVVTTRGDTIAIEQSRVWSDLCALHQHCDDGDAASVLRLYRGDVLPGFHIDAAPAFEHWLDGQRARVRQRVAQAAWTMAGAAERAGEWSRAAVLAETAMAADPDDEVAFRRLLSMYDQLGDRVRAVRTYEAFSARVANEYAIQPAPETQQLINSIRTRNRCREYGAPPTATEMPA